MLRLWNRLDDAIWNPKFRHVHYSVLHADHSDQGLNQRIVCLLNTQKRPKMEPSPVETDPLGDVLMVGDCRMIAVNLQPEILLEGVRISWISVAPV